jgi:hypothetical protein
VTARAAAVLLGPPRSRRATVARPLAVAGLAAALVGYLAAVDPNEPGHYPGCPFLMITGWYCPGCGSLRAVHALAHGHLGEALARNPLTVLTVPVLAWCWAMWTWRQVTGRQRETALPAWVIWGWLGVVLAFWVLRNLPGFGWLSPA